MRPTFRDTGNRVPGVGIANGSYGELLQGCRASGEHFLVTLPVNRYSVAVYVPDEAYAKVTVFPRSKIKAQQLASALATRLQVPYGGHVFLASELHEGKGMASSSADMVAVARAIAGTVSRGIGLDVLEAELRAIEPTDGVMHDGVVAYYHRQARLDCKLGPMFDCTIVSIDEGGHVDTIEYNAGLAPFSPEEVAEQEMLLQGIKTAFATRNIDEVGRVSTRSAALNQRRNPKQHFDAVLAISKRVGALGVVATHSGPCVGILLDNNHPDRIKQVDAVNDELVGLGLEPNIFETLITKDSAKSGPAVFGLPDGELLS